MSSPELVASIYDVFGGWPNVMQGMGGALVAVIGAYAIALWTARHEVRKDRERTREDAAVRAAGELIGVMAELPDALRGVKRLQVTSASGIDYANVKAWEDRRRRIQYQVTEHGALLPRELEDAAVGIYGKLGSLFVVDADEEHGVLIYVDRAGDETLDAFAAEAEHVIRRLQDFRRAPDAQPPPPKALEGSADDSGAPD